MNMTINVFLFQVKRGSLLSQPRSVLQKLANISEGNPMAPRNTRGFLFQTLSPEKDGKTSDAPQNQVRTEDCLDISGEGWNIRSHREQPHQESKQVNIKLKKQTARIKG